MRLSALVLALLAAGAAHAAAVEVVGPNLVVNGGFEEGQTGWNSRTTIVDDPVHSGQHAACLDYSADAKNLWAVQTYVPLKAFTPYRFRMALRRTTGQGYLYVHCNWYKAPGERLMISETWPAPRAIPATSRTGEHTNGWNIVEGEIRSNRADMGGIQLVVFLKDGNDTVYFDDVSLHEVRYPDAPAWELPDAVRFPGSAAPMGMAVEGVEQAGGVTTVTTTGAVWRLDPATGTLTGMQRIGAQREVVEVRFDEPLGELALAHHDAGAAVLQGGDLAFGFQADSLVALATNRALRYTVTSRIGARHFRRQDPTLLAIDDAGGFMVAPYSRPRLNSAGTDLDMAEQPTDRPGWSARYTTGAHDMAAFALFPGRPFDWAQSFRTRIVNTADCPEPDALRAFAQHANVLFLFGHVYEDHPGGDTHAPYRAKEPQRLRDTIKLAHELGMEVIVYRHPSSYAWADIPLDEGLADMARFRAEYGFDGWYLDGYPDWHSWYNTYRAMRILREEVGDGVIYTHCTLNPPHGLTTLYAPFIDSYSDFLLRGEGQLIRGPADPYLRYVVNQQHISNAIGTLKGDQMRATAAEGEEAKASLHDQLAAMLKLNARCRWAYPRFPFADTAADPYLGFYFPELDRQMAEWERTGEPPAMTWP